VVRGLIVLVSKQAEKLDRLVNCWLVAGLVILNEPDYLPPQRIRWRIFVLSNE